MPAWLQWFTVWRNRSNRKGGWFNLLKRCISPPSVEGAVSRFATRRQSYILSIAELKCAGIHTVVGWNPILQPAFEQDQAHDGTLLLLTSWLKEEGRTDHHAHNPINYTDKSNLLGQCTTMRSVLPVEGDRSTTTEGKVFVTATNMVVLWFFFFLLTLKMCFW